MANEANLYQPIKSVHKGQPPIALKVVVSKNVGMTEGGPIQDAHTIEAYVLLSALPAELQERIKLAVQMIVAGR